MFKFNLLLCLTLVHSAEYYIPSVTVTGLCHCDVTTSFCDYNCCCDSDCSSAVISKLNELGQLCRDNIKDTYCRDNSYYSTSTSSTSVVCESFNDTLTAQDEVTISINQTKALTTSTIPSEIATVFSSGYNAQTAFLTNVLDFSDTAGQCLSNTATGTSSNTLYFGRNLTATCSLGSSCNMSYRIYSQLLNKQISFFNGKSVGNVTITTNQSASTCVSILTILVFYSKLGASYSPNYYIQDIQTISQKTNSTNTLTLRIRFIDTSVLLKSAATVSAPSFFPMIPPDMFYPIFYKQQAHLGIILTLLCLLMLFN